MVAAASEGVIVGRVALAAVLGYLIGVERELRGKPAGERTFALVTLGSAAFTVAGVQHFPQADRIIQGVVTGIGFLGAGLIFRSAVSVHGLTTAASVWSAAAVGVLVGLGDLFVGSTVAVLVLLVLEIEHVPFVGRFLIVSDKRQEPPSPEDQPPER